MAAGIIPSLSVSSYRICLNILLSFMLLDLLELCSCLLILFMVSTIKVGMSNSTFPPYSIVMTKIFLISMNIIFKGL